MIGEAGIETRGTIGPLRRIGPARALASAFWLLSSRSDYALMEAFGWETGYDHAPLLQAAYYFG